MIMCIEQVKLTQHHLAMVHTDLDASLERHESVVKRIVDLEETLLNAEER